jgi:hypothetical protein
MTKWHIADEHNDYRPICGRQGDPTVPVTEWMKRIASDKCGHCAKREDEQRRAAAYAEANAKWPLPLSEESK